MCLTCPQTPHRLRTHGRKRTHTHTVSLAHSLTGGLSEGNADGQDTETRGTQPFWLKPLCQKRVVAVGKAGAFVPSLLVGRP